MLNFFEFVEIYTYHGQFFPLIDVFSLGFGEMVPNLLVTCCIEHFFNLSDWWERDIIDNSIHKNSIILYNCCFFFKELGNFFKYSYFQLQKMWQTFKKSVYIIQKGFRVLGRVGLCKGRALRKFTNYISASRINCDFLIQQHSNLPYLLILIF